MDLRCSGRLHGVVDDESHTIEVKCTRRACGHGPGFSVRHKFDLHTGRMETSIYRDPVKAQPESEEAP